MKENKEPNKMFKRNIKRVLQLFKKNFRFFSIISIIVFMVLGIFIINRRPFFINADQQLQYNYFYEEWIRLLIGTIKGQGFPFYSWNSFLGTDFYSSRSFHVIGDVILPFLIPLKIFTSKIELILLAETIICIYLSAIFMKIFLKEIGIKDNLVIDFISIAYSISGWATLFIGQYMFHRFYTFLPFLFFGVEYSFNHKKTHYFTIAVFILFLQNYYLMFPTSIFLVIYYLFSLVYFNHFISFKLTTIDILRLIFAYFIGLMMSAIIVVNAFAYILQNQRIGSQTGIALLWDIQVYMNIFSSLIINPFPLYTDYPNIFVSGYNGHAYWSSLYISSVCTGALFSSFIYNKNNRKKGLPFLLVTLIFFLIPSLNSIFHAFSEPTLRWGFLLIFLFLTLTANYLDSQPKAKNIMISYFIYLIFIIIFLTLGFISLGYNLVLFKEQLLNCSISILFGVFTIIVFLKNRKSAYVLALAELVVSSSFLIYTYNKNYYVYQDTIPKDQIDYYKSIDDDKMYRIYVNSEFLLPTSTMNLNQSIHIGYMSTVSYDSLYEPNLKEFLTINGVNWHIIDFKNNSINQLLGVKYYLVNDKSELNLMNISKVYSIGHFSVYKDLDYLPIAHTYTQFKKINMNEDYSTHNWYSELLVEEELLKDIDGLMASNIKDRFNIYDVYQNGLYGEIEISSPSVLFFSIPYNEGWKIKIDDKEVKYHKVNGGFMGVIIDEGYHSVTMNFIPKYFKISLIFSIIGFVLFIINIIKEKGFSDEKE